MFVKISCGNDIILLNAKHVSSLSTDDGDGTILGVCNGESYRVKMSLEGVTELLSDVPQELFIPEGKEQALRFCLKTLGDISIWQWKNQEYYNTVRVWIAAAYALGFPFDDFEIHVLGGEPAITFVERWLDENPGIH